MTNLFLYNGLKAVSDNIIDNWIGPAFFIGVAFFAIIFIKDREFRKLLAFLAIAAIVGALIFFGREFFKKEGKVTTTVKNTVDKLG